MGHILRRSAQSVWQFVISTKGTSKGMTDVQYGAGSPEEGAPFSWYRGAPSLQSDLWRLNTDVRFEHCTHTHMEYNQGQSPDSDPLLAKHVLWLGIASLEGRRSLLLRSHMSTYNQLSLALFSHPSTQRDTFF